jgi:[acyl-carrier-protein] S-malonyltransferase
MVAFAMFPGQGAQFVGMSSELQERSPIARDLLAEANDVLGYDLGALMRDGTEATLTRTDISQPAILVHSWMAWQTWQATQSDVTFVATGGLSLGEYTALLAAGVMSFADAVRLVHLRGTAMQAAAEARAGGMVALIGPDEAQAQALCDAVTDGDVLVVANLNSAGQVVLSGDASACERAVAAAREHGVRRAMPLPVAGAFHSPHMAPAAEQLAAALAEVDLQAPRIPVFANVTAQPVTDVETIRSLLVQQLTAPVRWAASLLAVREDLGADTFFEFGPGKSLGGMVARTVGKDVQTTAIDAPIAAE